MHDIFISKLEKVKRQVARFIARKEVHHLMPGVSNKATFAYAPGYFLFSPFLQVWRLGLGWMTIAVPRGPERLQMVVTCRALPWRERTLSATFLLLGARL